MSLVEIQDSLEYFDILREYPYVILDIFADWCKPCKEFEPELSRLSSDYKNIKFIKINIENLDDMCLDIETPKKIPTLYLYKDGKIIETFVGTNTIKLIELIKNNYL